MATHRIDALGEICPIPNIMAKRAVNKMAEGDLLIVETDHSCAVSFITDDMKELNLECWVEEVEPGIWQVFVRKVQVNGGSTNRENIV